MSEQTIQNELFSNSVTILDKYECLSLGATTIGDLIDTKSIKPLYTRRKLYTNCRQIERTS